MQNVIPLPRVDQGLLVKQLQAIFPDEKPNVNVRKELQLKYSAEDSHPIELDVWLLNKNVCFEFQDNYHYVTEWLYHASSKSVQLKDRHKKDVAHQKGIRLVVVPCWWDGSQESLRSTIHFHCPDLLEPSAEAITLNPPLDFFTEVDIPGVGELMYATYPFNFKVIFRQNWWLGEKYDGLRCCWIPTECALYSRYGNDYILLPKFSSTMSNVEIDGEVWFGRGQFSLTHAFVRRAPDSIAWNLLRIIAFDCPKISLQTSPFEVRYKHLLREMEREHPFVILAPRFGLSNSYVQGFIKTIIENDGEGVILRQVGSLYEHGRSPALVKLKTTFDDREAIVLAIKNKSIQLQLPNGIVFTVPPENVYVTNLAIGDVVTFSSENQAERHVPLHPKITKLRTDVSWKEIVSQFHKDVPSDTTRLKFGKRFSPDHMRTFLANFASKRKLDPQLADTWYSFTESDLSQSKRGKAILKRYAGYANAVQNLFPEIFFETWKFREAEVRNIRNRRQFFEVFAKRSGFNPLDPENWYFQSKKKIMRQMGAEKVISYHKKSISTALLDLFPEIGLDQSRFFNPKASTLSRRNFFETYASQNNFDPLNPESWYSQPKDMVNSRARYLTSYSNGGSKTVVDTFPEINFNSEKLRSFSWYSSINRRRLLEKYAKKHHFDPLVANNWYRQTRAQFVAGAKPVISYYNGSIANALLDLFPEIGLDKLRCRNLWFAETNARAYFEKFAKEAGFDPLVPENWYQQKKKHIMTLKGIYEVIHPYNNSVTSALIELFPEIGLAKAKFWKVAKAGRGKI